MNTDTFFRAPVTSAQCIIGTEKYPHSGNFLNYDDDYYSQGYGHIKDAFRALKKMISFNPTYQIIILDHPLTTIKLDKIYTFSIYDIRKT